MKTLKQTSLIFVVLVIFLFGCKSKQKQIVGEQKNIILNENELNLSSKKEQISISPLKTLKNYYGDNSILNDDIENFSINNSLDNLKLDSMTISRKKYSVKSYYFSNPVIVNNIVYILDTKGNLIAKDLNNSLKNIWKIKIIEKSNFMNYYGGKLSYSDNTIFITTRLNEIISVASNSNLKWRKQINSVPISTPIVEGDILYVITNDNKLYAFDKNNGRIKWIHYGNVKSSAIVGSADPVIYKNYVVASYSSGELFIIDKKNGNSIYNTNLTGKYFTYSSFELTDIDATPVIKNDILIATANNGITTGIDLKNFKILWKQNLASLSNILISGDHAFLITNENKIVCLNIKSGAIAWIKELEKYKNIKKQKDYIYYKSLFFVNNELVAFNNINQYKIFNPLDGELKDTKKIKYSLVSIPFTLNNRMHAIAEKGKTIKLVY